MDGLIAIEQSDLEGYLDLAVDLGISLLLALVILFIGFRIAGWLQRRVESALTRGDRIDITVARFLAALSKYVVIAATLIAVLDQLGVETTSLVAVLGAAGLAIGLAMQGTLSNVAAGVMLLLFRPFKVGDVVDVGGELGSISVIGLFTTEMDTPDNVRKIIPNASVWGASITNFSHHPKRRLDMVFGISYGDDMRKAKDIIVKLAEADERVHKDPAPFVVIGNLGDFSVDITVRLWVDAGDYWALKFDMTEAVKDAFDIGGVSIPFPTQTVIREG